MADFAVDSIPAWLDVSRETVERLCDFAMMARQWTSRINLVSPATVPDLWNRHILDSAQLFRLQGDLQGAWADIGTGGGFPGVVVAIIGLEHCPSRKFHFVESDRRKGAFLRKAVFELGLNVEIHASRAELIAPLSAGVVSARALAPLPALLAIAKRHVSAAGLCVLPKGGKFAEEIDLARRVWSFDLQIEPSFTDPEGRILLIRNIADV